MKKRRIAFAAILLCSFLFVFSPIAQASPVFGLDYLISGVQPNGNTPWLSAVFEDVGTGQVKLTMGAGNLSGSSQFVSDWYFNLDFKTGLKLSYDTGSDGPAAFGISFTPNGDVVKKGFNLQFSFFTANNDSTRFDAGEFVTYLFTGDGLTADLFDVANEDGYLTMAHVQGIGSQDDSAWLAQKSGAQPVPEPATMLLLGAGLIGLGFFGRKKSLK